MQRQGPEKAVNPSSRIQRVIHRGGAQLFPSLPLPVRAQKGRGEGEDRDAKKKKKYDQNPGAARADSDLLFFLFFCLNNLFTFLLSYALMSAEIARGEAVR